LCRILFEQCQIAGRKAVIDPDILAVASAETLERLRKGRHKGLRARIVLGEEIQSTDASYPLQLLGAPGGRPRCRPGEQCDEPAAVQWLAPGYSSGPGFFL
jgi:hypothetical protein